MRKILLLILFSWIFVGSTQAAEKTEPDKIAGKPAPADRPAPTISPEAIEQPSNFDTETIEKRPLQVTLSLGTKDSNIVLSVPQPNGKTSDIDFKPNIGEVYGISYSGLLGIIAFTTSAKSSDEDRSLNGRTRHSGLDIRTFGKRFVIMAGYAQYRGFYIDDADTPEGAIAPQNGDMYFRTLNFDFKWVAYPSNFSLRSLYNQSARQIRSGHSPIYGFDVRHELVDMNGLTVKKGTPPNELQDNNYFESVRMTAVSPKAGWGGQYNFTENWYAAGLILAGLPIQYLESTSDGKTERPTPEFGRLSLDAAFTFAYNGKRNYGGFVSSANTIQYDAHRVDISTVQTMARLFWGVRF